jgi:NAD-dependent SIR2 family protein deacetylase
VVFFLGAGASRGAGGPLIADFVPAIESAIQQRRVLQAAAEAFGKLQREAEESGIATENIEELLKRALSVSEPNRRERLRLVSQAIGATLEWRISFSYARERLASGDQAYCQLATLLRGLSDKNAENAAVVTVNYDVCADVAIMDAGRRCYYCLNLDAARSLNGEIRLAKLHGSLNWHGCVGGECSRIWADPHIVDFVSEHRNAWRDDPHHHVCFEKNERPCERCGHPLLFPLIVPPVRDKRIYGQQMKVLWDNARRMLHAADVVALVGYSCADIDESVNTLLREGGDGKQVLIANPSSEARERAMRLLPTARFMPAVEGLAQAVEAVRRELDA